MACDTERMTSEDRLSRRARAGRWLREQRQRAGFATAAEFGRAIGVSKEVVSNYEVGRSSVPDDRAEKIADVLGMDIIEVRRGLGLWVPDDRPTSEVIANARRIAEQIERKLAARTADDELIERVARVMKTESGRRKLAKALDLIEEN